MHRLKQLLWKILSNEVTARKQEGVKESSNVRRNAKPHSRGGSTPRGRGTKEGKNRVGRIEEVSSTSYHRIQSSPAHMITARGSRRGDVGWDPTAGLILISQSLWNTLPTEMNQDMVYGD